MSKVVIFLNQMRWKIKDSIFDFKMRRQRFKRGYADKDWWNMDVWFCKIIKPMLETLRDHTHSYPNEFESFDEWKKILNEMIYYADNMDIEKATDKFFKMKPIGSYENYKALSEEITFNKEKFFTLFSKYFYDLWD